MKSTRLKNGRRLFFAFALVLVTSCFLLPLVPQEKPDLQPWDGPESCTSITAGRLATADGSVITAHTCDGNYRQWLKIVPGAKYPEGTTTRVYTGKMHTETSTETAGITEKGEVPQVTETYAFLNTAYPCLNEHQLAIGETTINGKRELFNSSGMFMIEEIERLMLERCTTARQAIKLAGELVKQSGYGDFGECITIADKKEVWQFEIFGAGLKEKGAIWAAVRIPDDHIGVSANIPRISELNLKDPDHFMASDNVVSFAVEKGWYDPKSGQPFKFWKAYSGVKPFAIREYFIFNSLAPSHGLKMDMEELPFSVKPDKKVSVRDILALYRQTYEGTEFDPTKNLLVTDRRTGQPGKSPVASPFMSREMAALLNSIKPDVIDRTRTIAIAGCAYATVLQCRGWLPDPVGGVCWFAFDNPAESARFPIFAGVTELPVSFEVCAQHRYRTDSAAWVFRRANRLATVRWGETKDIIQKTIADFEERAFRELPFVEKIASDLYGKGDNPEGIKKARAYLTKYTNDFARATMSAYWELGDRFWTMFSRGF
ncbi:MAG: peptidase [Candidatus Aminicenantes bacterium RBG_16_63_16]|nr:MAG: peptidase [Candidatus Aminicenantes bacterium RBG_16_63_16]